MKRYWAEFCVFVATVLVVGLIARNYPGLLITASCASGVVLWAAIRWTDNDVSRWCSCLVFALCGALIALSTYHWVAANGFIFTRDFGESFSVYLAAFNVRDFTTFMLQDLSTDPDPGGHPFLYTHQPSFVARLSSLVLQRLGFGIPANMAVNFVIATLFLWSMARALGRQLPWTVVLGGTFFAVSSYSLFHENIVDLSRAPGYFALFGGVAIVANDAELRRWTSKLGLAAAVAVAAATDFVVCLFVVYTVTAIQLWLSKGIRWRRLVLWIIAPCLLFYAAYFATAARSVGLDFFVTDMLFSYFGRAGQSIPHEILSSLGLTVARYDDIDSMRRLYQEANVVLWTRSPQTFHVKTLLEAVTSSWLQQGGSFVAVGMALAAVTSLLLTLAGTPRSRLVIAGGGALLVICWVSWKFPLLFLLAIPAAFMLILPNAAVPRPILGILGWNYDSRRRAENAVVFTATAAMGLLAVASVFPEYGIRFIISERRGVPGPFLEMLSFGLFLYVIVLVIRSAYRWERVAVAMRWAIATFGIMLMALVIGTVVKVNADVFRRSRPTPPPYLEMLSRPEYAYEPFVTTSFYGQTWYFTRGWTYMVPNPPEEPFVDYWKLRHMRDWRNVGKYGRPHYFLCDNTRLKGYAVALPSPDSCPGRLCNCVDVASYMRDRGYVPIIIRPDFAIIDVRNPHGSLHHHDPTNAGSSSNAAQWVSEASESRERGGIPREGRGTP